MRIVAGRLKGRRLKTPAGRLVRPTSEGLRETLFNVLGDLVAGAAVLDGFAGTGAIGLEAVSRGALGVTFVERDREVVRLIEANVAACGVQEACVIIRSDFAGISARARRIGRFDLVIVDPPYEHADLVDVVREAAALLAPAGRVVLEYSRRRAAPDPPAGLTRTRVLVAGDSALAFYEHA
jgi:16S rRNA (guanine(966)-N(2))-methyltransferase RsmD